MPLAEDRRRHQRVKVNLLGCYMLADRREFPCQVVDMSPGGMALQAYVFDVASVPSRDAHLPRLSDRHRHASIIVATVRMEQRPCRGGIRRRRAAVSVKTRGPLWSSHSM
ncbi:MAG: PilZ domain-containing protein [Sphingobacteriales bacterium]